MIRILSLALVAIASALTEENYRTSLQRFEDIALDVVFEVGNDHSLAEIEAIVKKSLELIFERSPDADVVEVLTAISLRDLDLTTLFFRRACLERVLERGSRLRKDCANSAECIQADIHITKIRREMRIVNDAIATTI